MECPLSNSQNTCVTFTNTAFAWPDGTPVLADVTESFGVGGTGLIGANCTGISS